MHEELTRVLFALALVLLLARLAGQVATAWKLPPVLGELTVGVLVGNLTLLPGADPLVHTFVGATLCATSVGISARVLQDLLEPLVGVFAPIFFVVVGMRVDLTELMHVDVLALAASLTVVAIIGKQLCGLGVREPGIDRWSVGLGMIPRGEVGMIFAGVGATTLLGSGPVLDPGTYAALILTVFATTIVTPPLLALALERAQSNHSTEAVTTAPSSERS
jgi:Kef-type K+ transport system membrane component KefB